MKKLPENKALSKVHVCDIAKNYIMFETLGTHQLNGIE